MDLNPFIYSLAENAYRNFNSQLLEFTALHTKSTLNTYNDAVNYILLYQTIRQNRRALQLGCEFFSNQLPQHGEALLTVLKGVLSSCVPVEWATNVVDYCIGSLDQLAKTNDPAISSYAKDMIRLQNETSKLLQI